MSDAEKDREQEKSCPNADDEAECPKCAATMRLWAGYFRCPNCGYKESCCF
jgi:hypothetical protein